MNLVTLPIAGQLKADITYAPLPGGNKGCAMFGLKVKTRSYLLIECINAVKITAQITVNYQAGNVLVQ